MRILILDDDLRNMPAICDEIAQSGHEVRLVSDWNELPTVLLQFKPDAILLDLMIPPVGLPADECGGGFTTGAYIYEKLIHNAAIGVPVAVFSSAYLETPTMKHALKRLEQFPEYRGAISKGCNTEEVIELVRQTK